MPSPFPGMDPWLEHPDVWPGVHAALLTYARDRLQAQLRPGYYADIGERVWIESSSGGRPLFPGVSVGARPTTVPGRGTTVLEADAPVIVVLEDAIERREGFVEIRARGGRKLVTAIEVLSHSNKRPGPNRELYRKKQAEVLASDASLVEIDLLRGGEPTVALPEEKQRGSLYRAVTARAGDRLRHELYPVGLRERLPRVSIPVTPEHGDVVLDLPDLAFELYGKGAYGERLDYAEDPVPPLAPSDAAWARERIAEAKRA